VVLALYRKYRPATLAEVVGQEHVTAPLRAALAAQRINHAYLFSGPRGCGKTSSARILARSLNCDKGPTPDPCGVCPSCVALAPEGPGSVDVVELDAASHGGVDDARELRDRAFYTPAESRYRVFVIDEAHMVTTQGFNALLKIVEEPPEHLVFIFATTEPDKVLATIRSRTHHYPFRLLPPSTMRALLEQVCDQEGVQVEPAVYPLVIRAGGGSARDSLSVLDQLLAGAGEAGVTYARAVALLGVTDAALLDDMVSALAAGDGAAAFGTIDRLVEAGHDPRRFASDLLQRFRDLVLLRVASDAARQGLVDAPEDQLTAMSDQSEHLGVGTLTRYAEIVHGGLTEMRGATAPRLLLELLCARMLLPAADPADGGGAMLHRLERLERRLAVAPEPEPPAPQPAPEPPAPQSEPESQPEPATPSAPSAERTPADSPPAGELDAAAVRRVWQELLDAVRGKSRATQALMMNATARSVEADVLVLMLPTAPLARLLAEDRHVDMIRAALHDVLGVDWRIRCEHEGDSRGGASRAPRPPDPPEPPEPTPPRRPVGSASPPHPSGSASPPRPAGREEDEESMLVEAARREQAPTDRRDPEEAALELLAEQLGARRIEER
jgi:DNA polymerase-3 subunit gamma/tau